FLIKILVRQHSKLRTKLLEHSLLFRGGGDLEHPISIIASNGLEVFHVCVEGLLYKHILFWLPAWPLQPIENLLNRTRLIQQGLFRVNEFDEVLPILSGFSPVTFLQELRIVRILVG